MDFYVMALQQSALGQLLDASRNVAIALQVVHILAFTGVLAIVTVTLANVFDWVFTGRAAGELVTALQGCYRGALLLALLSGALQSLPRLVTYTHNASFVWKQAFILLAIILQAVLHRRLLLEGQPQLEIAHPKEPWLNRALAAAALGFWLLTAAAGRAIGFT